jgi:hypothetical protein
LTLSKKSIAARRAKKQRNDGETIALRVNPMANKQTSDCDDGAVSGSRPVLGRPAKPEGEKYKTPQRQLGRVSDEDWETLKSAAAKRGETFSAWALAVLKRAAKRELGR